MSWAPDICIYHGNCDDGFGAAWAIWKRWPQCRFVPGFYGKPLALEIDELLGMDVLFVDFSLHRSALTTMATIATSIVVIDHHKTAEAELAHWNGPKPPIEDLELLIAKACTETGYPVVAWFDMSQSGAVMAWDFAHGIPRNDPPPRMLAYIQDRDLWHFAFGDRTKMFSAALRTYPMEFAVWDQLARDPDALIPEGEIVLRSHQSNLRKILAEAYTTELAGHIIPVVNAPYHYCSDAAHELLLAHPSAPFAASWFRRGDGKIQWSLRSEDGRADVSEVATSLGGGGHRNAAGFEVAA